jgi:hypothetical protein
MPLHSSGQVKRPVGISIAQEADEIHEFEIRHGL